ncbi:MAG: hypothetical protein ACFE75_05240 [Candidatus Hodarchaeota archaeon]
MERHKEDLPESEDKVELVFGNATEIFTRPDDVDYYFFALRNDDNSSTVAYIQITHPLMNFEDGKKPKKSQLEKDLYAQMKMAENFLNFVQAVIV